MADCGAGCDRVRWASWNTRVTAVGGKFRRGKSGSSGHPGSLAGAEGVQRHRLPFPSLWASTGKGSRSPSPSAPAQSQQLILVTLGPGAGAGRPGSWPQLAGEPGLDSVIRRKPEPGHKL